MKELSAFDIHSLTEEVDFLKGAKIDNIYQIDTKDVYLQIYVRDKTKQLLRIIAGKCFYLTKTRPEFPENIHRFCSYARKYLLNGKIQSIQQIGFERIIDIKISTNNGMYDLFVELFGKGNLILVKNNAIVLVAEEQIWADRTVKPGQEYVHPERGYDFLTLSQDDIVSFLNSTKQESLVKALASDVGLGGLYAERVVSDAGLDKDANPRIVDPTVLFVALLKLRGDKSPITMQKIDEELSKEVVSSQKVNSAKEKERMKINNVIHKQQQLLQKAIDDSREFKEKGDLLYKNYLELNDMIVKLKTMKGKSWNIIKEELEKYKIFKGINEKEGVMVVDLQ